MGSVTGRGAAGRLVLVLLCHVGCPMPDKFSKSVKQALEGRHVGLVYPGESQAVCPQPEPGRGE